jgi:hypothetical protein
VPQSKKGKKRARDEGAKPKPRKLALAAKSFIDDEAIDDDEEPEYEDFDEDNDFIDYGDGQPSKSARSAGKSSARGQGSTAYKPSKKSINSSTSSDTTRVPKDSGEWTRVQILHVSDDRSRQGRARPQASVARARPGARAGARAHCRRAV